MADDTTTVNQPQAEEAGGAQESSSDHDSFLGLEPEMGDPAEATPEPTADESTEGEEAQADGTEGEAQADGEEQPEHTDDTFLANLTAEEHAYYAKRYPTLYAAAQDPNQPADLRQAFLDRVNQDREFEKMRSGNGEGEEEPTSDDQAEVDASQGDPEQQRATYYQQVDSLVKEVLDPKAIDEMGMSVLKALAVDVTSKDPEVQALVKNAPEVGRVLARGAVDIIATSLPAVLLRQDADGVPFISRIIDAVYPGTIENHERQQYQSAWEEVRNSSSDYKEFPAYGPQGSDFGKFIAEQAAKIPNFDRIQFPGTKAEQAHAKYALLAKVASGQKATPAVVAQAIDAGKRQATEQKRKVAAGRAMGSGQSSQEFQNSKEDSVMDDLEREIGRQNDSFAPFQRKK